MRSPDEQAVATAIIALMREVVYRDTPAHEPVWEALGRHRAAVADHFAAIGVDVIVDENEGYAFLRTREPEEGDDALPRLVRRRSLTYNVSLLLVLLRRRMVEFEASGEAGKLVLTRDQIVELLRVFQASSTNEARIVEQADRTIAQVADLGFLRELRGQRGAWEVRRILKAYVDAQTLADFASRLAAYAGAPPNGQAEASLVPTVPDTSESEGDS
ncbi:DUF4194 domain-containing protein [Microbacterium sp. NEAU-LLC]|uniref:DUF4194 domain-containing protein n=1 Tax=Microbacterium helvum TaxID=2773713 RepID=A0ABR8NHT1_9MICO|nr:DUF4194 domain-containing protein [Microbacterium helvum]MBD3940257.1 DUF4194 domain-containing protein [Microbacterium helvum]